MISCDSLIQRIRQLGLGPLARAGRHLAAQALAAACAARTAVPMSTTTQSDRSQGSYMGAARSRFRNRNISVTVIMSLAAR